MGCCRAAKILLMASDEPYLFRTAKSRNVLFSSFLLKIKIEKIVTECSYIREAKTTAKTKPIKISDVR